MNARPDAPSAHWHPKGACANVKALHRPVIDLKDRPAPSLRTGYSVDQLEPIGCNALRPAVLPHNG